MALAELQEDLRIQGASGRVGSTQEKGSNGMILSPSSGDAGEKPFAGVKQWIYALPGESKPSSPFPSWIWKSLSLLTYLKAVPNSGLGCAQGFGSHGVRADVVSVGCQQLPEVPWDPQQPMVSFQRVG